MKFKVLKQSHLKRNILIGVIVVAIISAIVLNFIRAKYRNTQSIPLVNGTINYSLADLNIVAITVDGEPSDTIPEGNYELTEESYCTVNGEEDSSITISYEADIQLLTLTPFTTKGTKCYLDFKKATTRPVDTTLLGTINVNLDTPDFSKSSCTNGSNDGGDCGEETVGIYEETTSRGTTYYWRGDVDNNYLIFANKYWRIIRINADETIRIIYSGEKSEVDAAGKERVLANGYYDGITDYKQIQESAFNSLRTASYYVGYTYQTNAQRPSSQNEGTASTIKEILDTWYSNNLASYDNKIASGGSAGFCNDRNSYLNTSGTTASWVASGSTIYYAPFVRVYTTHQPTLECGNNSDLYTTKIGLITADEVMYAGQGNSNLGYYLYTGSSYWTMSPYYYNVYARVFYVHRYGYLMDTTVDTVYGVRPVINLSSDVTITGTGTIDDPYQVVGA